MFFELNNSNILEYDKIKFIEYNAMHFYMM